MKMNLPIQLCIFLLAGTATADTYHAQGEMAGEVSETSAILQSRLTASKGLVDGDVPGASGFGLFEYSSNDEFQDSMKTELLSAKADYDYILKAKIKGLKPATKYFYRLKFGEDKNSLKTGPTRSFRTLQGKDGDKQVSFIVVTGMNYPSFHFGTPKNGVRSGKRAYQESDKDLGYPALAAMMKLKPDFFIGTGDNVYYDSHDKEEAIDVTGMRRKWHEQLVQPRFVELFSNTSVYWEKDDHDHRYNDCDLEGDRPPLSDLGIRIFREQVPVTDPLDADAKTYRTFRLNRNLQIWLVEGRDYRSPNKMKDGPDKTLWGAEQIAWLKKTLSASDAAFKILISPTPMVGPDDAYKIDNHTNHKGFRHEGREFFAWIKEQQLDEKGFYLICGDRHWQYHSVDSTGIEEFSCGAICDANSRGGRNPGDPKSTDLKAEIKQLHRQKQASGGFLRVLALKTGEAKFEFYDEKGELLYQVTKTQ